MSSNQEHAAQAPAAQDLQQYIMNTVAAMLQAQGGAAQHPRPTFANVKLHQPDSFNGITSKFNAVTWLASWEVYFESAGIINDAEKIKVLTPRLQEMAILWYIQLKRSKPECRLSWELFKHEFLQRYQPIDASRTARSILKNMRQNNNNLDGYTNAFLRQLTLVDKMEEADKIEYYVDGLTNIEVKKQLLLCTPQLDTLTDVIVKAKQVAVTLNRVQGKRTNEKLGITIMEQILINIKVDLITIKAEKLSRQ